MGLEEMASLLFSVWKALLTGRRDEQLGMGVFLILEYQKSFSPLRLDPLRLTKLMLI